MPNTRQALALGLEEVDVSLLKVAPHARQLVSVIEGLSRREASVALLIAYFILALCNHPEDVQKGVDETDIAWFGSEGSLALSSLIAMRYGGTVGTDQPTKH